MRNSKGSILAITVGFALVFTMLGTASIYMSTLQSEMQEKQILSQKAFWLAEAGINHAIARLLSDSANNVSIPDNFQSGQINVTSEGRTSYSWSAPSTEQIITDSQGIQSFVRTYTITSTGSLSISPLSVTLTQQADRRRTFIFQNAVFYNDDLELFPGKLMTFNGRIFSNNNIYLGSDGSTVTINGEYLHTAGNIYNVRKDGGSGVSGTVNIKVTGSSNYVDMHNPPAPYPKPLDSTDANWLSDSQNAWNGTVETSTNGVTKQAVPVVGSIAPGGYYNSNAGIVVTNGAITSNGVALSEGPAGPGKIPAGTITTSSTTFWDAREGAYIHMTTIDLKKLSGSDSGNPGYTNYLNQNTSGLLYATNSNAHPGVRLKNGSQINSLSSGLTVVTNDPLYIQGDYNTVSKKSSAVIADSVNILSNNWQDNKSSGGLSGRAATETTVNTAFIAGVDTTTSGNYNGGLENYPRLLENWSSVDLNVTGSFVELWDSSVAQGAWGTSGVYDPPNRVWSYDSFFNDAHNMPPFAPFAVGIVRGRWTQV